MNTLFPEFIFEIINNEVSGITINDKNTNSITFEDLKYLSLISILQSKKVGLVRVYPPNTWFVYIVYCSDGTLYTGISKDVSRRIQEHGTNKGAKYTRYRSPVYLVYCEICDNRSDASKREYNLKQFSRREKLNLIISKKDELENFYFYYLEPRFKLRQSDY